MPVLELFMMRGSPPSYAVMALLREMKIPYKATELDYFAGEQFKDDHVQRNPQREVPVIKDGDYTLSESAAILQYLCEQHGKNHQSLYPADPKQRGIINHRLAYNLTNYYPNVATYIFGDVYGVPGADSLKAKAERATSVLEIILKKQGTKFSAGNSFTIADIALLTTAICMEAGNFDFSPYPCTAKWYELCKTEHPAMWEEFKACRDDLSFYFKNPPKKEDLAKLNKIRDESFQKLN